MAPPRISLRLSSALQIICLACALLCLSTSRAEVILISPTPAPTPAPTFVLNQADANAFAQLSANLNRASWRDCNATGVDPCRVCSSNTNDHAVICESVQGQRRIVGFRFRNLNIIGRVDQFALFAFSAVRIVDFSSDVSQPYINQILLAQNDICANVPLCLQPNAVCNFGPVAPVCNGTESQVITAGEAEPVGLYVGVGVAAVAVIILAFGGVFWYSRHLKRMQDDDEDYEDDEESMHRERRRSRLAMEQYQLQQQQMMMMHQPQQYMSPVAMGEGIFAGQAMAPSTSSAGGSRREKDPRKSFSSLRTRRKSYQKKTQGRRPSQSGPPAPSAPPLMPESSQPQWVQQIDPATGAPYWVNPATGAVRLEPPMQKKGSKKILVEHGSTKNLKRSGSTKNLKSTGSQRRMPAAPPPSAPPALRGSNSMMSMVPSGGMQPPPGLAGSPWQEVVDGSTGATYWVNSYTGQFSVTRPM